MLLAEGQRPLPALEYEVRFVVDAEVFSVVCRTSGEANAWSCDAPQGATIHAVESLGGDELAVRIWRSEGVELRGPEDVSVQIWTDGAVVAEESYAPGYALLEQDEEGCPSCHNLESRTIDLNAP